MALTNLLYPEYRSATSVKQKVHILSAFVTFVSLALTLAPVPDVARCGDSEIDSGPASNRGSDSRGGK
jgi:hypothetical protein